MLEVRLRSPWLFLLGVLALVGSANLGRADALEDRAREAFDAGVDASRRGEWARAREMFERSHDLVAKPHTLLNLAIAEVRLGRGKEALEALAALESMVDPAAQRGLMDAARALHAEASELAERERTSAPAPKRPARSASQSSQVDPRELAAREAFAAGSYQTAADLFARLYAERPHPNYLHNIGRCYQNLGDVERALASFREFLRKAEELTPETRTQVEDYIRELEALQQRPDLEAVALSEPPPGPPEPPATTPRAAPLDRSDTGNVRALDHGLSARAITGLSLLGGGAGALGLGTFFGVRSLHAYEHAEAACPSRRACSDDALDERALAERRARLANASVGVGAALAVAGTCLLWADRRARKRATRAGLRARSFGLGLALEGAF